jgi:hypothetical protein
VLDVDFDFVLGEGDGLFAAGRTTTETEVKRIIQKARQKKRDDIGIEKGIRLTGIAD